VPPSRSPCRTGRARASRNSRSRARFELGSPIVSAAGSPLRRLSQYNLKVYENNLVFSFPASAELPHKRSVVSRSHMAQIRLNKAPSKMFSCCASKPYHATTRTTTNNNQKEKNSEGCSYHQVAGRVVRGGVMVCGLLCRSDVSSCSADLPVPAGQPSEKCGLDPRPVPAAANFRSLKNRCGLQCHRFAFKCAQPHWLTAPTPTASHFFKHTTTAHTTFGTAAVIGQMPCRDVIPVAANQHTTT
jgi:hypothetical protein